MGCIRFAWVARVSIYIRGKRWQAVEAVKVGEGVKEGWEGWEGGWKVGRLDEKTEVNGKKAGRFHPPVHLVNTGQKSPVLDEISPANLGRKRGCPLFDAYPLPL